MSVLSLGYVECGVNSVQTPLLPLVVEQYNNIDVNVPAQQLANKSMQVSTSDAKLYSDWTRNDHSDSFTMLQKVASVWKKNGIAEQYLVYGKIQTGSEVPFNWEIVPYYKPSTSMGSIWQQLCILWNISFGGATLSETQKQHQIREYKELFEGSQDISEKVYTTVIGNDVFCKPEVNHKQSVLEGKTIRVLYNYSPIGFGGERLHFLIVPKEHRVDFGAVEGEEYAEASALTQKLVKHFYGTRPIQEVYLFHKTGKDAGQTVPHWHMHVIMTSNSAQNIFGKLTVLKNMLFGSSPMKDCELRDKVVSLRAELNYIENER